GAELDVPTSPNRQPGGRGTARRRHARDRRRKAEVMRTLSVLGLVVAMAAGAAAAGDWPQFRGPNLSGVADAGGLPDRWRPGENVRWRSALPGRGVSSAVVIGER